MKTQEEFTDQELRFMGNLEEFGCVSESGEIKGPFLNLEEPAESEFTYSVKQSDDGLTFKTFSIGFSGKSSFKSFETKRMS